MYLEQCTADQLKEVYGEFNVTVETLERDTKTLKEWLEKQPHLPNVKDENFLRLFLLRCKASLERAKQTLEMYFIYKAQRAQIFTTRDPTSTEFRKFYDLVPCFILPKLTSKLNRVVIVRINNIPSNAYPSSETFLRSLMTLLTLNNLGSGFHRKMVIIVDGKNLTAALVPLLMANLSKALTMITDLVPVRIEAMYLLNSSALLDPLLVIARKLSKKLFQERLIVWKKDEKDLIEVIPRDVLPVEYGGSNGGCEELAEQYFKEMITWKIWLDEENKNVANLDLIPEDKKKIIDKGEFGVEGSFRKLDLD